MLQQFEYTFKYKVYMKCLVLIIEENAQAKTLTVREGDLR